MPSYNGVSYGEVNGRGEGGEPGGCSFFHLFPAGEDGFCSSCRPAPDHPVIVAAEEWMVETGMKKPNYGSKAWLDGLNAWHIAGRPGDPDKK